MSAVGLACIICIFAHCGATDATSRRISMTTQAEALSGQLAVERSHLLRFPAQEAAEFAGYLRSKGVRPALAAAVADDVAASAGGVDAALDIHAVRADVAHMVCSHAMHLYLLTWHVC